MECVLRARFACTDEYFSAEIITKLRKVNDQMDRCTSRSRNICEMYVKAGLFMWWEPINEMWGHNVHAELNNLLKDLLTESVCVRVRECEYLAPAGNTARLLLVEWILHISLFLSPHGACSSPPSHSRFLPMSMEKVTKTTRNNNNQIWYVKKHVFGYNSEEIWRYRVRCRSGEWMFLFSAEREVEQSA